MSGEGGPGRLVTQMPPTSPTTAAATNAATGIWFGLGAYGLWGLVPLFWPLAEPASALEILAHRIVWSLVCSIVLVLVGRRRGWLGSEGLSRLRSPRVVLLLVAAAILVCVNWGVYIWAVNSGHVVEAALGYYINPILSILAGVVLLRERLRGPQWVAVGLAAVAVTVLTVGYGQPPWVAVALATSFAGYGLIKNRLAMSAVTALAVESAALTLPALGYLIWLGSHGSPAFGHHVRASIALVAAGPVTVVPLLLFAGAATRIGLSMIGLLQYVTPTCQFLLGVLWFGESMPASRWIGFAIVWLALLLLGSDAVRQLRGRASARRSSVPVTAGEPVDRAAG